MEKCIVEKDRGGMEGLCLITPAVHGDPRGYFMETFNLRDLAESGLNISFVQDNECRSVKGVLRGLHFQKQHPQTKLVRVSSGRVFDVAVDLRPGSAAYGKWHGEILSGENKKQMLIPRGFAHGYLVLSDTAVFCYKCDEYYYPEDEGGVAWNDPGIGIEWPGLSCDDTGGYSVEGTPLILSARDQKWGRLADMGA